MRKDYPITVLQEPYSTFAEAFRKLQVNLDLINADGTNKVLQIVSTQSGEGKTISALNIAAVYAERKEKVILVDLDLRRPKIHRAFQIENKNGLTDYFLGEITREQLIQHTEPGIDIIVRGREASYPNIILNSTKFAQLIASLREEYDFVILDCPPLLVVSDALIISKHSDGVLLIAAMNQTPKESFQEALRLLKQNNIKVFGINLTRVETKKSGYGDHYHYYEYNDKEENAAGK